MLPLGIRLNNPGNMERRADHWQGMSADQPDPRFLKFDAPAYGLRAIMIDLVNKQKRGLNTVTQIISAWAPLSDGNPTDAYIHHVAGHMRVDPEDTLDLAGNAAQLRDMVQAMVVQEQGYAPADQPVFWYDAGIYDDAQRMAS